MKKTKQDKLSLYQAATQAGVGESTLWRHIRSGQLPAVQQARGYNRPWLIKRADLEKYLKAKAKAK